MKHHILILLPRHYSQINWSGQKPGKSPKLVSKNDVSVVFRWKPAVLPLLWRDTSGNHGAAWLMKYSKSLFILYQKCFHVINTKLQKQNRSCMTGMSSACSSDQGCYENESMRRCMRRCTKHLALPYTSITGTFPCFLLSTNIHLPLWEKNGKWIYLEFSVL